MKILIAANLRKRTYQPVPAHLRQDSPFYNFIRKKCATLVMSSLKVLSSSAMQSSYTVEARIPLAHLKNAAPNSYKNGTRCAYSTDFSILT